ncbi:MAG: hypothetical protein FD153_2017 [Rhodospirillaceae bacterium]|nr:MAG: hypothetical protein FD153_2017 [Rhodospirillaceae bacterium]
MEVHGQFESHGLLDPLTHRVALDSFAGLDTTPVIEAWRAWQAQARIRAVCRG